MRISDWSSDVCSSDLIGGQDADRELMLDAQPLGDRAVQIARAEPQFVRQQLGGGIEIGEMVAPALDLAPYQIERIAARHRWRRTLSDPVIGARKRLGAAGG